MSKICGPYRARGWGLKYTTTQALLRRLVDAIRRVDVKERRVVYTRGVYPRPDERDPSVLDSAEFEEFDAKKIGTEDIVEAMTAQGQSRKFLV